MRLPSFKYPANICRTPVSTVTANKYSRPCSLTKVTINNAMAPVAAETIPERPPVKAITTEILKEAYKPTLGSTPAMIEKAMASGIKASATTRPASRSPRMFDIQSSLIFLYIEFSIWARKNAPEIDLGYGRVLL